MSTLHMVNLQAQYLRYKVEIDAAIERVCNHAQYIKGPEVALFERELAEFLGVKHVIGVANGTDALQIAFMCLNLSPGDEVILPAFTYAALPEVLLLLGLKPVYVDVDPHTFLIDLNQIPSKITERTRVIAPVHLYGRSVNMDVLRDIAAQHELFVIEDAAQSLGSYFQGDSAHGFTGTLGDIGTTSFFPSKNLGCFGDGGAIFTQEDHFADLVRSISNHGQKKKYFHEIIGVNSRLDTIQAAILRVKLPYLNQFNELRRAVAWNYNLAFRDIKGVEIPLFERDSRNHIFHQYTLKIKNGRRDELVQYLSEQGIPSMIYYPLPLHQQKAYAASVSLMVSETLSQEVISLPICPELTKIEQEKIINTLISFFKV